MLGEQKPPDRWWVGRESSDRLFPGALLQSRTLEELTLRLQKEYLLQLHIDRGGDLEAMAADLGITVRALYVRFQRLGIRPGELGA